MEAQGSDSMEDDVIKAEQELYWLKESTAWNDTCH